MQSSGELIGMGFMVGSDRLNWGLGYLKDIKYVYIYMTIMQKFD